MPAPLVQAGIAIGAKLLPELLRGALDVAKDMPKLLYIYNDDPAKNVFLGENGYSFGPRWETAWAFLKQHGADKSLLQVSPDGKHVVGGRSPSAGNVKYFLQGNVPADGYMTIGPGFKGLTTGSDGEKYDANKLTPAQSIKESIGRSTTQAARVESEQGSIGLMVGLVGLALVVIATMRK